MFRKSRKRITYKSKEVVIRPASLDEEYEVGGWATTYPWVRMGYEDYKNEPKYIYETLKFIAEARNMFIEELDKITTENARRVFLNGK